MHLTSQAHRHSRRGSRRPPPLDWCMYIVDVCCMQFDYVDCLFDYPRLIDFIYQMISCIICMVFVDVIFLVWIHFDLLHARHAIVGI